ncbi:hypothetical protein OBRU01_18224, partial [Operophtera brumata]
MVKTNTKNLVYHCRADKSDCDAALAKMRYKASKHFYALAKAVVDYELQRSAKTTSACRTQTPPSCLGGATHSSPAAATRPGISTLSYTRRIEADSNEFL